MGGRISKRIVSIQQANGTMVDCLHKTSSLVPVTVAAGSESGDTVHARLRKPDKDQNRNAANTQRRLCECVCVSVCVCLIYVSGAEGEGKHDGREET